MSDVSQKSFLDHFLLREILELSSDTTWVLDVRERKVSWFATAEARALYGITEKEQPFDDFLEKTGDKTKRWIEQFLDPKKKANHSVVEQQLENWQHNGEYFKVRTKTKAISDSTGTVVYLVGVWNEVSSQKQDTLENVEISPRDYKYLFNQLCDIADVVMWEVDFVTDQIRWWGTERVLYSYGIEGRVTSFANWEDILHPEDRSRATATFHQVAIDRKEKYFDRYRIVKRDGTSAYVIDNGIFKYDSFGKPRLALGTWVDITKDMEMESSLKNALTYQQQLNEELATREEELSSSEEELRQINEQLSIHLAKLTEYQFVLNQSQKLAKIASWGLDLDNQEVTWSEGMHELYQVPPTFDFNDRSFENQRCLYDDASVEKLLNAFENITKGVISFFDVTLQGGTSVRNKWFRVTASLVSNDRRERKLIGLTYDITSFKETEEKLRVSEMKFSKAFLFNPNLMTIFRESDGIIVDLNEKVLPMMGYERSEVIGKPAYAIHLFTKSDDRDLFYYYYNRDGYVQFETKWNRKDGSIVDVRISSTRVELDGENHLLSVVQDISPRKLAEEKFQKAFNMSPDLMLIFRESDFCLIEVNSKLEEMSGFTRGEVLGRSTKEFELWEDQKVREQALEEYHQFGFIYRESLFKVKNRTFYGTISMQRIVLAGENHALAVIRDISDKKIAEGRIIQNEAHLHAVINNTDLQVWSLDTEGRFTMFNAPYREFVEKVFGREVYVGKKMFENSKTKELQRLKHKWEEMYQRALAGESFKFNDVSGGKYFLFSIRPIQNQDIVTGVTVFAEDITERKLAEQKIIESEARLDAIINNSNMLIWSLDMDYRITAMNKLFNDTISQMRGFCYQIGDNILEYNSKDESEEYYSYWKSLYDRAFAGERVIEQTESKLRSYITSVNPILENSRIIGISVFSQDITDRKQKEDEFQRKTIELAEANKKIGELKLTALRSFMNPHFIFNALNSIQYFIATNDRLNAINYLSTFSKLIRGILTHSVDNKISLADELDLIKHYVNLESVRFENKFDFVLNIDPELDLEYIEIPSLLIQPFVENAILHGLCNKKERGKLTIKVRQLTGKVLFEVEDDGIGRKAAKMLRELNFPKHKSVGLMLTEERLRLINEHENVGFDIQDLADDHGKATGTRVKIWVKV